MEIDSSCWFKARCELIFSYGTMVDRYLNVIRILTCDGLGYLWGTSLSKCIGKVGSLELELDLYFLKSEGGDLIELVQTTTNLFVTFSKSGGR